jgi:hypothetical protein
MTVPEVPFVDVPGLLDLVGELHAALEQADVELDEIEQTPQPMPDWVQEALDERLGLLAALRGAPEEWKPRLRELFTAANGREFDWRPMPAYPVDEQVRGRIGEVLELVRRRALLDVHLADALRDTG